MKTTLFTALLLLLSISLVAQDEDHQSALQVAKIKYKNLLANRLAETATDLLEKGERTNAFRLAEFAYRYVDSSYQVAQVIHDAYYFDKCDHFGLADSLRRFWNKPWVNHSSPIRFIHFSTDQRKVLVHDINHTISIFETNSKKLIRKIGSDTKAISSAKFVPHQDAVLVRYQSDTIQLIEIETGNIVYTISPENYYGKIISSEDGQFFATPNYYHEQIEIWETQTGALAKSLKIPSSRFYLVGFLSDNTSLLLTKYSKETDSYGVELWDIASGERKYNLPMTVKEASFIPNSNFFFTQSDSIRVWSAETGKLVSTIAFKKDVSEFKMAAVGEYWLGKDGDQLYIWKLHTANWKHSGEKYSTMTYEYPTRTIVLDTEIKAIAFTEKGDVVKIMSSFAEQAFLHQIPLNAPRCPPRTRLDLSARKDVAFRYDENYRYAMAVGSSLHTTTLDNKPLSHSSFEQKGRLDIAKFAPDATLLATTHQARDSNIISIWKLHPLQKKYQLKNSYIEVRDLAISPNNRYLAAITRDPLQLEIWQLEEQKLLHIFELPDTYIESLIFSPDGKMLATNSGLVYDLEKGERLFEIAFEDSNRTTNLTFSSDGKLLASHFRNSEGILKVWNGKTGKEIRSFPLAQDTRLLHPQSTPDGKEIILMGNKDISFLDLSSGKIVRKYDHYYGWISGAGNAKVKVSKDQEYLVFGESRGLRCIRLSTAALLEEYKDRLAALTKEQLEDYGLMETLEQLPNVWDAILEQEDAMQLHYFGDFFLEKVGKNYNPLVFDPLFEQAERFYLKAAERSNTDINRASLSKLYVRWARHFYKAEDYEQAKSKALLANEWQIDFNSLGILNTSCKILNEVLNWEAYANGSSKREVADLLSKDYQSEEALQLYRDLDYQDLPIRRRLEIYEKDLQLGKDRFQELIATNDVEELESLQSQLRIKNWRNLEKRALIAEKIFALDSTLENRLKLHFIAFATGKNYSESLFDNLDNSTDRAIVLNAMITNYLFESEEIRTYLNQLVKQIVLEDIDTERYDEFKGLDPFDKLYFVAQLYTLALTNEENALEVVSSHLDTTELADFYFDYFMQKTSTYFSKKVREAFYKKHLENYLELALQLDLPKHPRAKTDQYLNQLNNLGWRLLEKGEFAMGEAYIRLGIRINPDFDCFYTNLAPSLLLQGKYEAAKIEYEKWVDQTCTCGRSKRLYQSFFSQDLSSLKRLGTIPEEHLSKVEEIKVWLRNK